jgi:hypothetical protein
MQLNLATLEAAETAIENLITELDKLPGGHKNSIEFRGEMDVVDLNKALNAIRKNREVQQDSL